MGYSPNRTNFEKIEVSPIKICGIFKRKQDWEKEIRECESFCAKSIHNKNREKKDVKFYDKI